MSRSAGFHWRKTANNLAAHLVWGKPKSSGSIYHEKGHAVCGVRMWGTNENYGATYLHDDYPHLCWWCTSRAQQWPDLFEKFHTEWVANKARQLGQYSPQRGIGGASDHAQTATEKGYPMPSNSLITNSVTRAHRTVKRSTLSIYDLFKRKPDGRTYMHTGTRTQPPSGGKAEVSVNGVKVGSFDTTKAIGRTANGDSIVGFQSLVVAPSANGRGVSRGEDGTTVSFVDEDVILVGRARITLDLN